MDFGNPQELHHVLATVWFLIIGLFMVFYVVLDGFDLGVGVLSLFVGERRRKVMMASLGSIWDANETWLVVIGGTLFGAFPLAYGTVLHGLYIPIILMLLGFMLRGVSFEFHELSERKAFWGAMFGLGSLLATIAQGFALGGLLNGVKVVNGVYVGSVWEWLSPFSVIVPSPMSTNWRTASERELACPVSFIQVSMRSTSSSSSRNSSRSVLPMANLQLSGESPVCN